MTNDVRTLLLNMSAVNSGAGLAGEEFVPADYKPPTLPRNLARAREAFFGAGADRTGMNITLARFLGYAHASILRDDLLLRDTRLSYDPRNPADVFGSVGATAENLTGDESIGWAGRPAFDAPGRGYGQWHVRGDGAGSATITSQSGAVTTVESETGTLGDIVWLPGSSTGLVIPTDSDGEWRVSLVALPAHEWTAISEYPAAGELFHPIDSVAEARWRAVWLGDYFPVDQAVAVTLALAARIRDLIP